LQHETLLPLLRNAALDRATLIGPRCSGGFVVLLCVLHATTMLFRPLSFLSAELELELAIALLALFCVVGVARFCGLPDAPNWVEVLHVVVY
jgi:hypothetical protein